MREVVDPAILDRLNAEQPLPMGLNRLGEVPQSALESAAFLASIPVKFHPAAFVPWGISKGLQAITGSETLGKPAEWIDRLTTVQPQTETGKNVAGLVEAPFVGLERAGEAAADYVREKTLPYLGETGSALAATTAGTIPKFFPFAVAGRHFLKPKPSTSLPTPTEKPTPKNYFAEEPLPVQAETIPAQPLQLPWKPIPDPFNPELVADKLITEKRAMPWERPKLVKQMTEPRGEVLPKGVENIPKSDIMEPVTGQKGKGTPTVETPKPVGGGKYNQRAIRKYGLTTTYESVGYITRDGKGIDSSGIRQGSSSQGRNIDHREIAQHGLGDDSKAGFSENMRLFMNATGDIRVVGAKNELNIDTPIAKGMPSQKQLEFVRKMSANKKMYYDFTDEKGNVVKAGEGTYETFLKDLRQVVQDESEMKSALSSGGIPRQLQPMADFIKNNNLTKEEFSDIRYNRNNPLHETLNKLMDRASLGVGKVWDDFGFNHQGEFYDKVTNKPLPNPSAPPKEGGVIEQSTLPAKEGFLLPKESILPVNIKPSKTLKPVTDEATLKRLEQPVKTVNTVTQPIETVKSVPPRAETVTAPSEKAGTAIAKQPWMMTRKEIYGTLQQAERGEKHPPKPPGYETEYFDPYNTPFGIIHDKIDAKRISNLDPIFSWTHEGNVIIKTMNHEKVVRKALSEGLPVPPEVLKDYPDLQSAPPRVETVPAPSEKAGTAITKQPWEMTREEYRNGIREGQLRQTSWGGLTQKQALTMHDNAAKSNHEFVVKKALSEDKPVPPEVLKDYPDLQGLPISPKVASEASKPEKIKLPQKGKEKSTDLLAWVRGKGGIDPDTVSADVQELTQKESGFKGNASLVRKGGRPLDELAQEWGWERGGEVTTDQLTDAIKDAVQSKKAGIPRKTGLGVTDAQAEQVIARQEREHFREQIAKADEEFADWKTHQDLTKSFDDEIMGWKEEKRLEGWSEEDISTGLRDVAESLKGEAIPQVDEGFREILSKELTRKTKEVTKPELSPTAKNQFKLPGMKQGLEMKGGKEVTPTLKGTPLFEAARKAEVDRVQPSLVNLFKSGKKEITQAELRNLPDVKSGAKTVGEMKDYLLGKGIQITK